METMTEKISKTTEEVKLNIPINMKNMMKFAVPSMIGMVVIQVFNMVNGIIATNILDIDAFAAFNITMPFWMAIMAVAFMFATGGSALIAKQQGEGLAEKARENFSLILVFIFVSSVIISVGSFLFMEQTLGRLGATGHLADYVQAYLTPILLLLPFSLMGMAVPTFFITDGKPELGSMLLSTGPIITTLLTWGLLHFTDMGIEALGWAISIAYIVPAVWGVGYFSFARTGSLYIVKPKMDMRALGGAMYNGSSELITMLATSVSMGVLNNIVIRQHGEETLAALGIIMALNAVITSAALGYSFGVAPITSFNYGKLDKLKLKSQFKISMGIIGVISLAAVAIANVFASPLVSIYVPQGSHIYEMAIGGIRLFSIGFLFSGVNVFVINMFTAYNNGLVSSVLSVLRTLVFLLMSLHLLPRMMGLNGVWLSVPIGEVMGVGAVVLAIILFRRKYYYL